LGVFDSVSTGGTPLCGWDGVTAQQLRDIVVQYLYTHPADRHERANYLVVRALQAAFPCR
jgi:hypothetical protein